MSLSAVPYAPLFSVSLWVAVAGVGVAGLVLAPEEPAVDGGASGRPRASAVPIEVPMASQAEAAGTVSAEAGPVGVVASPDDSPPAAPAVSALAQGAVVAFAVPVAVPARLVTGVEAASGLVRAEAPVGASGGAAGAPVARLAFGVGAGRQPAPPYPRRAVVEGSEGTVSVRFAVDAKGGVMIARVAGSSGHALLDAAAVDTVRRRWRFEPGTPRVYEVDILFRLER